MFGKWLFALLAPLAMAVTLSACEQQGVQPGIQAAPAGAEVRTASGDVVLGETGGPVQVHTASGDVRVGSMGPGSAGLRSMSGDILVGVRAGARLFVDATSMSGDLASELPVGDVQAGADGEVDLELRASTMRSCIRVLIA